MLNVRRFRTFESGTILACQPGVRSIVVGKHFLFRIEFQHRSHRERILFQIDTVVFQVLYRPAQRGCVVIQTLDTGKHTLGIPAMTAYYGAFANGPVAGKTVMVTGAGGSIGSELCSPT